MFFMSTNKVCHEESAFRKYSELIKAFIMCLINMLCVQEGCRGLLAR